MGSYRAYTGKTERERPHEIEVWKTSLGGSAGTLVTLTFHGEETKPGGKAGAKLPRVVVELTRPEARELADRLARFLREMELPADGTPFVCAYCGNDRLIGREPECPARGGGKCYPPRSGW